MLQEKDKTPPKPEHFPNYFLKYFLPGILLMGCAFWAGTHQEMIFAFAGFLSFFVAGVTLIAEGWKQKSGQRTKRKDQH